MAALDSTTSRSGSAPRYGAILTLLCTGQFMVFLCLSSVNLALPAIKNDLGMSEVSLNYIVTAYGTVLGGFLLLGGRLADTFGRRRVLNLGFVLFALASALSALAWNGISLIAGRGLTGLAAAFIAPAALSILTNVFPEGPGRNKALGVWGSLAGLASILGVILGGLLTQGPGWEWIFWLNVPVGLAAAALSPGIVPESVSEERRHRFDIAGALVLTVSLLLLIFTLGEATHVGWGSFRTIGGLVVVAVLWAAFLLIESKVKAPIMPLRIFRLRTMRTANMAAVLVFGMFTALYFFASLFMQQVFGYSPLVAGFAYVPLGIAVAMGAWLASSLLGKMPARPVLIAALVISVAGLLLLWRAPAGGSYLIDLLPGFLLLGLGNGACFVTLQIAAFVGVSNEEAGLGAGLINTSQEAGGALGLAVVATIAYAGIGPALAAAGDDPNAVRTTLESANHTAFLTAAVLGVLSVLLAFMLPKSTSPGFAQQPASDNPQIAYDN
jgi:EmrB/QacA subfamily drug resistance transporter